MQQQRPVTKAGFVIVTAPVHGTQSVLLLHVGAVGRGKPFDREEPAAGLEVAQLQQEAAAHVGGAHGSEYGRGPFRQVKEELPLGQRELGGGIKRTALGRVEQGQGAGHDRRGWLKNVPFPVPRGPPETGRLAR